ncbi:hypothetical protein PCANB_000061 [Pneumocystis canis]|nr:hypothetical protein PCANB_000061 [Pneumocystis canis]
MDSYDENINKRDPYIMKRLSESIDILLKRRQELWKRNRDIVKIGIEMEHNLLPVEYGRNMLRKQTEKTEKVENI